MSFLVLLWVKTSKFLLSTECKFCPSDIGTCLLNPVMCASALGWGISALYVVHSAFTKLEKESIYPKKCQKASQHVFSSWQLPMRRQCDSVTYGEIPILILGKKHARASKQDRTQYNLLWWDYFVGGQRKLQVVWILIPLQNAWFLSL